MHEDLHFWRLFDPTFNGVCLIPYICHPDPIQTDASKRGYGAIWSERFIIGIWNCYIEPMTLGSQCTHVINPPHLEDPYFENINVLELWAVVAALELWGSECSNQTIKIVTDNRQVMFMIINGASVNVKCMSWLRKLFWIAMNINVRYAPKYIPSAENVGPDALSRLPYYTDVHNVIDKLSDLNLCCLQSVLSYVIDKCPDANTEGEEV